jgi:hypothetical protein
MFLHLYWPRERLLDGLRAAFARDGRPRVRELKAEERGREEVAAPIVWTHWGYDGYRASPPSMRHPPPAPLRAERGADGTVRYVGGWESASFIIEPVLERDESLDFIASTTFPVIVGGERPHFEAEDRPLAEHVGDTHVRIALHLDPVPGSRYARLTMNPGTKWMNTAAYSPVVRRWAHEVLAASGGLFVAYKAEAGEYIALLNEHGGHVKEWNTSSDAFYDEFVEWPEGEGWRINPDAFATAALAALEGAS